MADICSSWMKCGGPYTVPKDEVHVWRANVNVPAYHQMLRVVSADERERAARFRLQRDLCRAVIARGTLRLLLAQILHHPAETLQFEYGRFGKPRLNPRQAESLEFNVSHSGDLILIAFARGRPLGVDVERYRCDLEMLKMAPLFMPPNKFENWASLPDPARSRAFFVHWTSREAHLKAAGVGLTDQVDLPFLDCCFGRERQQDLQRWILLPLDLGHDYIGAVVAFGRYCKLKCLDWDKSNLIGSG